MRLASDCWQSEEGGNFPTEVRTARGHAGKRFLPISRAFLFVNSHVGRFWPTMLGEGFLRRLLNCSFIGANRSSSTPTPAPFPFP
jgi:hypothetical protein